MSISFAFPGFRILSLILLGQLLILSCKNASVDGLKSGALDGQQDGWSLDQIISAKDRCIKAEVEKKGDLSVDQRLLFCDCMMKSASLLWQYGDYVKNEGTYNQKLSTDGMALKCYESAIAAVPSIKASLSNLPQKHSRETEFSINVGGGGVENYRFKFGIADSINCDIASGYSQVTSVTIPVKNLITSLESSLYKLCVVGQSTDGSWQRFKEATVAVWEVDRTGPASEISMQVLSASSGVSLIWKGSLDDVDGFLLVRTDNHYGTGFVPSDGEAYKVGQAMGQLISSRVVFVGKDMTFEDSILSVGLVRHYQLYAFDKLKNYTAVSAQVFDKSKPAYFQVLTPGPTVTSRDFAVTWDSSQRAVSYELKIGLTRDCRNPVAHFPSVTGTTQSVTGLEDGSYFICVTANDSYGQFTSSASVGFLIDTVLPGEFLINDFKTSVQFAPDISWGTSGEAIKYNVSYSRTSDCKSDALPSCAENGAREAGVNATLVTPPDSVAVLVAALVKNSTIPLAGPGTALVARRT